MGELQELRERLGGRARYGVYVFREDHDAGGLAVGRKLKDVAECDLLEELGGMIDRVRREGEWNDEDRVGVRDRWERFWLICPFAPGR